MPPPTSVFKFFGKNRVEDFTKGIFYAAHPSQFNDPFECSPLFVKEINPNLVQCVKANFLSTIINRDAKFLYEDAFSKRPYKTFIELIYRQLGMIPTCGNVDDTRMWAYYNNHEGFAVEIDTSKIPSLVKTVDNDWTLEVLGLFPINYVNNFPSININGGDLKLKSIALSLLKQKKKWKHEKEWRIVFNSKDGENLGSPLLKGWSPSIRRIKLPTECIKAVYLGANFIFSFNPDGYLTTEQELMAEYLLNNKETIKVYQMVSNNDCFNYTPCKTDFQFSNGVWLAWDWKDKKYIEIGHRTIVTKHIYPSSENLV